MKADLLIPEQKGRMGRAYGVYVQYTDADGKLCLEPYGSLDAAVIACDAANERIAANEGFRSVRLEPAVSPTPAHPGELRLSMQLRESCELYALAALFVEYSGSKLSFPTDLMNALRHICQGEPVAQHSRIVDMILATADAIRGTTQWQEGAPCRESD